MIIRAIGPQLIRYGVPNVLANPTLELHGRGGLIASNDNWHDNDHRWHDHLPTKSRRIRASGHAPGDGRELGIIADLPAGNYTAILRGVNNTRGVALVEAVRSAIGMAL